MQIFVCVAVKGLKNENAPSAGTESVDFVECGYLHYSRVTPAKRRLHSHIYTHTIRYGTLHTTGICLVQHAHWMRQ